MTCKLMGSLDAGTTFRACSKQQICVFFSLTCAFFAWKNCLVIIIGIATSTETIDWQWYDNGQEYSSCQKLFYLLVVNVSACLFVSNIVPYWPRLSPLYLLLL